MILAALGLLLGGPWPLLDRSWGTKSALKALFFQTKWPLSLQASEHLSLQVASAGAAKRKQFLGKILEMS